MTRLQSGPGARSSAHLRAATIRTACLAAALLIAVFIASTARADDKDGLPDASVATSLNGGPDKEFRADLAKKGITYGVDYVGEGWGNSGGAYQGATYLGRLEVSVVADLEKLWGAKDLKFHVNGYQIHGEGLEKYLGGPLMTISSIEALPSSRLFEIWLEQDFGEHVSLRAGQLGIDSEFFVSETAANFVNATFGWAAIWANDLPNGANAYPLATPGVRMKVDLSDNLAFLAAVYNGDPAGCVDGQRCNRNGTDFRMQSPPLVIQEFQYKYNQRAKSGDDANETVKPDTDDDDDDDDDDSVQPEVGRKKNGHHAPTDVLSLPGTFKIGAWQHYGRFDGVYSATLLDNGYDDVRRQRFKRDFGFYGVIDQQIYAHRHDPAKGVSVFARVAGAPSDRNLIDFYIDGGVFFSGFVKHRAYDSFGAAFAFCQISGDAQAADRYIANTLDSAYAIRNFEAAAELFYRFQVVSGFYIQPDIQYMWNPGANVAGNSDALYGSVRFSISY
ncbi:carbohydrate porin [Rhodomicrobium sp. Az07]|uniref:carbohydrate porin n=1 Tax=Rhodomicrobium sp. Az07 TaxID=2839034 RepID=UPI0035304941